MCVGRRCEKREGVVSLVEQHLMNLESEAGIHSEGPGVPALLKSLGFLCTLWRSGARKDL